MSDDEENRSNVGMVEMTPMGHGKGEKIVRPPKTMKETEKKRKTASAGEKTSPEKEKEERLKKRMTEKEEKEKEEEVEEEAEESEEEERVEERKKGRRATEEEEEGIGRSVTMTEEQLKRLVERIRKGERKRRNRKRQGTDEEESEEEEKEGKEKPKGKRIALPKIKGDELNEGEIRRFVQKVREKVREKEQISDITRDMSSALMGRAYDIYAAYTNKKKIRTRKELEEVLQAMLESVTTKVGIIAKCKELEERGQGKESIKVWGTTVKRELAEYQEIAEYSRVETFVNGLAEERLKKKVLMKIGDEKKNWQMEEVVEVAIRLAKKLKRVETARSKTEVESQKGTRGGEKKEEPIVEGKTIAPIFKINIDPAMCREIVRTGGGSEGDRRREQERSKERGRGPVPNSDRKDECWRCGQQGHRSFECTNEKICYTCGREGHVKADCSTSYCDACNRYGHSKQQCWVANPSLKRGGRGGYRGGRGGDRGRGGSDRGGRGNRGGGGGRGGRGRGEAPGGVRTVAAVEGEEEGKVKVSISVGDNKDGGDYAMCIEGKKRKMTEKERASLGKEGKGKNMRRMKRLRKEYRIRTKRRERKGKKGEMEGEGWKIEEATTMEEMEERMDEVDRKAKKKEEEEEGKAQTIASVETKEYTGAIAVIEIAKKQVRVLVDSGACTTLISWAWVEYLGLRKIVNEKEEVPKDLKGASGEAMGMKGAIWLRMKIGRREVEWKAWVAERMVVPMILGNDFHDGKSVVDYHRHVWSYEGEEIPIQIEKKGDRPGERLTVVAAMKMKIPQYSMMVGIGRIVNEGGMEPSRKTVEFVGAVWGGSRIETETGIATTEMRKDERGRRVEEIRVLYVNKGDIPMSIRKGNIIGCIKGVNDIVGAIAKREDCATSETSKTQRASSTRKEKEDEEEESKRGSDRTGQPVDKGAAVGEKEREEDRWGNEPPRRESMVFHEGAGQEIRSKGLHGIEGYWPVRLSGGIEGPTAPSITRSGDIAVQAWNEGEYLSKGEEAREEGVLPSPSDILTRKDAEDVVIRESTEGMQGLPTVSSVQEVPDIHGGETQGTLAYKGNIIEREEQKGREEGAEASAVAYAGEEEIDKMIADAKVTPEQKKILKESLMKRREAFAEDLRPAGQASFDPHRIRLKTDDPV